MFRSQSYAGIYFDVIPIVIEKQPEQLTALVVNIMPTGASLRLFERDLKLNFVQWRLRVRFQLLSAKPWGMRHLQYRRRQ